MNAICGKPTFSKGKNKIQILKIDKGKCICTLLNYTCLKLTTNPGVIFAKNNSGIVRKLHGNSFLYCIMD